MRFLSLDSRTWHSEILSYELLSMRLEFKKESKTNRVKLRHNNTNKIGRWNVGKKILGSRYSADQNLQNAV